MAKLHAVQCIGLALLCSISDIRNLHLLSSTTSTTFIYSNHARESTLSTPPYLLALCAGPATHAETCPAPILQDDVPRWSPLLHQHHPSIANPQLHPRYFPVTQCLPPTPDYYCRSSRDPVVRPADVDEPRRSQDCTFLVCNTESQ